MAEHWAAATLDQELLQLPPVACLPRKCHKLLEHMLQTRAGFPGPLSALLSQHSVFFLHSDLDTLHV